MELAARRLALFSAAGLIAVACGGTLPAAKGNYDGGAGADASSGGSGAGGSAGVAGRGGNSGSGGVGTGGSDGGGQRVDASAGGGGSGGTSAGGGSAGTTAAGDAAAGGASGAGGGGATGGAGGTGTIYNDIGNAASWSTFDTTGVDSSAKSFSGAAFDGRYIYFAPYAGGYGGTATRYDTQAPFGSPTSWATFNTLDLDSSAAGFVGAVFDGRYVYFVPNHDTGSNVVVRYDTQGAFTAAGSWSTYATTIANGFCGAVFDGRYVYLVPPPFLNGRAIARYDTQAAFTSNGSWSKFDVSTLGGGDLCGGVFDGRFVYFAPNYQGYADGLVPRYDSQTSFTSSSSWSLFNATSVTAGPAVFWGGAFDGRYVYFAPWNNGSFFGTAIRYDTHAGFGSSVSWSAFDMTGINAGAKGFRGAAFDGRYVYFVPGNNGSPDGVVTRYDTKSGFAATTSWSTFDTGTLATPAAGFVGAVFDGRYLYFVPNVDGVVARFDAKSPRSMPAGYSGSFF